MKIAFFSFADIDNFGDILFSHIFKMELEKRVNNLSIDFYTPTDYSVEGIDYIAYTREKIEKGKYDALIVFGGEVIHLFDERTWKPIYKKNNQMLETELPSDVIFDWTDMSEPFKAWISVGVRPIENEADYNKIQKAIEDLDYVSARGNLSKKILENQKLQVNNSKIEITPDMGWLFPNLLDYTNTRNTFYKKYIKEEKYLVFQINNITKEEAKEIADYLYEFYEKEGLKIVLLPVIRPWEDYKYLNMIYDEYPSHFLLLDNNLSILEIADILIHADLVLTSSLHANITALSAGIPGGIINKWQGTKLQDLYGHQFRLNMLKHNLSEIPSLLQDLEKEKQTQSLKLYAEFMKQSLVIVFDNLIENMKNKRNG
ncbi:polysaccharide pyruvyl transferase family protein [Tenacibaculum larymnensis]|uniref:Polysaccharide pyruvyl transferase family protein n=1 Tax=Tenacibaculum larymnensis TaxID=2878201 RepID=A0A9X4EQ08_9FLAO|nr:polysaccharide pyruvyl transferase family protein [Tenacibaculum larymnensis]MDE1208101.1 polysaccharide pyruvyl transferase family protein [Tenacibaculum larymnensis]